MQYLREQAGAEKGLLAQLAASSAVHLEPGSTYALLPRPWLAAWRTYIGASGKRGTLSDVRRPQPLPEAVAETFCSCHAFQTGHPEQPVHLNIPPPTIVRRWALVQAAVISDVSVRSSRQMCNPSLVGITFVWGKGHKLMGITSPNIRPSIPDAGARTTIHSLVSGPTAMQQNAQGVSGNPHDFSWEKDQRRYAISHAGEAGGCRTPRIRTLLSWSIRQTGSTS